MASFCIENFGCRAARADGEALSTRLRAGGLAESSLADATVVILNTCSVTAEADADARAAIRKAQRLNPAAKVVVTGCYAQRAPEEIAALPGVTAVVGNSHKGLLPELVPGLIADAGARATQSLISPKNLLLAGSNIWADDAFAHSFIEDAQVVVGDQTRPNLKIQEGCGNRCTFCVIPTTRGASRSLSVDKVLAQVRGFMAAGGNELVLSGINLGRWGHDLAERRAFSGLVREILETTSLPRLRLSSIEPMDWTPELIALMREFGGSNLARHAHLPLQSGSDAVLRRMHRRYRPWHYEEKIAALVEAAPQLAIGADVMAGFPGESDAEFRETHDLIARLPFAYLHLFPFSPRPGTRGWELHREHAVSSHAVAERMAALRLLAQRKTRAFRMSFVGATLPAITLKTPASLAAPFPGQGRTSALTDNFLPVELRGSYSANQLLNLNVCEINAEGALICELHSIGRNMTNGRDMAVAS
jgi:threonylcarbamoyladenosine tRNA methylthiotransferase MtaB